MSEERTAWGWGLASVDAAGNTLDVWYPELKLGEAPAKPRARTTISALWRMTRPTPVACAACRCSPCQAGRADRDAADAYLRLHLLSMRLAKPNTLNLDGIFAKLTNVVWTNYGPFAVEDFALRKLDVERPPPAQSRAPGWPPHPPPLSTCCRLTSSRA